MSGVSPSSVLFSSDGTELAVVNNTLIPTGTRAILFAGQNPNANATFLNATIDGTLGAAQLTNRAFIQVAATVTTSGSATTNSMQNGAQEAALVVNVGAVTGSGSIQYTIQESDGGVAYGNTATTAVINTGNTPGVFTAVLNVTTASEYLVTWTVTGTFSATISSHVITKTTPSSQVISGSITATNPSVGTDGAAALGFDTQVGGKTTTSAPTYVNGNLDALSLTTLGGLRIDGVYAAGTANATAADVMNSGGYVTTAAPTYTTGELEPLSLTTLGGLRIDGVYATGTANATAADANVSGGYVTTAAPTYTTGQLNALSLDTSGNLRVLANQGTSPWVVSGTAVNNQSVGADAATALAFDTQVGGKTTTAAPTYVNGNLDVLSLTTAGGLRIDGVYPVTTTTTNAPDMQVSGGYVTRLAPTYSDSTINALSLDGYGNLRTVSVTNKSSTSAVTSVVSSASNTVILASNQNRIFCSIFNGANKTMYIKLGTTASTTSYSIQLFSGSYWEVPQDYQGEIDAVWASGPTGNALVTELTP